MPISAPAPVSGDLLREKATQIRIRSLQMTHRAGIGHPGGDFSAADILATLYFAVLQIDPCNPDASERDRFIMSKGHCSGSFYATLASAGFFPESELATYMQPLSRLNGHPDRNKLPGVEANTGALGHGLPIAVGCALAARMNHAAWRTFVLVGDGELQEGSNWEAAMTAAHYRLDRLVLIIDRNRIQQGDWTENTTCMEPLQNRWSAFGWAVAEVDGHDFAALLKVLTKLPLAAGKPNCIIAHTIKGNGVSFMENQPLWHHHVPTDEELDAAIAELQGQTR